MEDLVTLQGREKMIWSTYSSIFSMFINIFKSQVFQVREMSVDKLKICSQLNKIHKLKFLIDSGRNYDDHGTEFVNDLFSFGEFNVDMEIEMKLINSLNKMATEAIILLQELFAKK